MSTVGVFTNMIHDLPLNAKINFIINGVNYFANSISLIQNSYIQITLLPRDPSQKYLNDITQLITQNNLDNNVHIYITYIGYRHIIDIVDISLLSNDGIIRFHLVRS